MLLLFFVLIPQLIPYWSESSDSELGFTFVTLIQGLGQGQGWKGDVCASLVDQLTGYHGGEGRGRPSPHTRTGALQEGRTRKQGQQQRGGRVQVGVHQRGIH